MANTIPFETNRAVLHNRLISVNRVLDHNVGEYMRSTMRLDEYKDELLDRLVYQLSAYVLAEKLVEKTIEREVEFEHKVVYPSTWWQHFKTDVLMKSFLTRWFVRWRPTRWTTKYKYERSVLRADFRQYALYPAVDYIVTPETFHHNVVIPHEQTNIFFTGPSQ